MRYCPSTVVVKWRNFVLIFINRCIMKKFLFFIAMLATATGFTQEQPYWHNSPSPSGTNKKLLSISFGSSTVGYIGGVDSLMLKTTDGGQSWQPLLLTGITMSVGVNDIVDVDFVSPTVGYITLTNHQFPYLLGRVYKTNNGGSSWTLINAGNIAAYRTHFFAEGNGFVIGSAFFAGNAVSKLSADTPNIYHTFSFDGTSFNLSVDFLNAQTGIIGGERGQAYRTFNGGSTWDTVQTMTTDTAILAIRFLNDTTILASTVDRLIISHDSGLHWDTDFNSLTFDYPAMKEIITSAKDSFVAVGYGAALQEYGVIYWHDGEYNRQQHADHPLNGVAMCNDSIGYAVGDSGLIVTNRTVPVVGVHTPSQLEKALKIYPNPTTGMFTTSLSVLHTIKVYDFSGRLITTNNMPAMIQHIDLSAYSSGAYFLNIATTQESINRKVVLQR